MAVCAEKEVLVKYPRFIVVDFPTAYAMGVDVEIYPDNLCILDTSTNPPTYVGEDIVDDVSLLTSFSWVVNALNKLAAENE